MPIEPQPGGLDIDLSHPLSEQELKQKVARAEEEESPFLVVTVTPEEWEKAQQLLCELRAVGVGALIQMKEGEDDIDEEEIQILFRWLRDWDQMTVSNFLVLCEGWVPKEYSPALLNEAKIEQKWLREWLTAAGDQRIAKYPALPWRGYIRKVVDENFKFASRFLELASGPSTTATVQSMNDLMRSYLVAKKKVLCVFPKNWGRSN